MRSKQRIRVHYPSDKGTIALRTEQDWDFDRLPGNRDEVRGTHDFEVTVDGPFALVKPVLLTREGATWARGENVLVFPTGRSRIDIHPHFFEAPPEERHVEVRLEGEGGRCHDLHVHLPPGYRENGLGSYPVVWMQDGQNLFADAAGGSATKWDLDRSVEKLDAIGLIRAPIIVGVSPADRMADYTMPGYADYGRFLVEVAKPWLDRNFRTIDDPRQVAVMGSSLGGVVSFYLAWEHPQVFGHAICQSSTFGWQDDLMARVATEKRRNIRIYLDSGHPRDNFEVTLAFRRLLLARGYRTGRDLFYLAFPEAKHDEAAWGSRAPIPLQYVFAS